MDIAALARPEILAMQPYESARSSMSADGILLNANEAPCTLVDDPGFAGLELNRYPPPQPAALVDRLARLYGVGTDQLLVTRGSDEGIDRWDNVLGLRRLASEYEERTLTEFLEALALVSDQDTLDETANAPTLLTLHAAKGLEFDCVHIVNMHAGSIPMQFPDSDVIEEFCLAYTACSRARKKLRMYMAGDEKVSPYIEYMFDKFKETFDIRQSLGYNTDEDEEEEWD